MPQTPKQPADFMQRAESVGNPQGPLNPSHCAAAARSLAYGSAAGLAGAALLGALAWRYLGSHESQEGASWKEDWREQLLAAGRPWAEGWQQRLGIQNTLVRS